MCPSETQPMVRFQDCPRPGTLGRLEFPSSGRKKGEVVVGVARPAGACSPEGPTPGLSVSREEPAAHVHLLPHTPQLIGPEAECHQVPEPVIPAPGSTRAGLPSASVRIWPSLRNTVRPAAESSRAGAEGQRVPGCGGGRTRWCLGLAAGREEGGRARVPPSQRCAGTSAGREGARRGRPAGQGRHSRALGPTWPPPHHRHMWDHHRAGAVTMKVSPQDPRRPSMGTRRRLAGAPGAGSPGRRSHQGPRAAADAHPPAHPGGSPQSHAAQLGEAGPSRRGPGQPGHGTGGHTEPGGTAFVPEPNSRSPRWSVTSTRVPVATEGGSSSLRTSTFLPWSVA